MVLLHQQYLAVRYTTLRACVLDCQRVDNIWHCSVCMICSNHNLLRVPHHFTIHSLHLRHMFPQHLAPEINNLSKKVSKTFSKTYPKRVEKSQGKKSIQDLANPRGMLKKQWKQLVKLLIIKSAIFVWANHGERVGTPFLNP